MILGLLLCSLCRSALLPFIVQTTFHISPENETVSLVWSFVFIVVPASAPRLRDRPGVPNEFVWRFVWWWRGTSRVLVLTLFSVQKTLELFRPDIVS